MSRETWEKIGQRFDPNTPPEPRWRADRDLSPVDDIVHALDRPWEVPRVLLTGTTGTGKTTELLRVAERRAAKGDEVVIFLDLDRHFQQTVGDSEALQSIASWEVCYLVGVALVRAAEDRFGYQFPDDQRADLAAAWKLLAKATDTPAPGPPIDVGALAKSLVLLVSSTAAPTAPAAAVGLKLLEGAVDPAVRAVKWSMGRSKQAVLDQDAGAQNLLACVNRMLATFKKWATRVFFIIDGLDRIRDIDRAEKLFVTSEMIGRLDCPLVVCGPFALRNHMAAALARSFAQRVTLANAPVLLERYPREYGTGVAFLCELYKKRVADLGPGELVDPADLERLAYYSGGRARDFVRTIRMLAGEAWDVGAPRATTEMVDRVLKQARLGLEEGLDTGHIEILTRVVLDPQHKLPPDDRARELLNYHRLLPYSNGSEWFYPHPLLTMRMVLAEPPPPGSGP